VLFTITRPDETPLLADAEIAVVEPPRPRAKPAGARPGPEGGPDVQGLTKDEWLGLGQGLDLVATVERHPTDGTMTIYVFKEYEPLMQRLRAEAADEQQLVTYQSKFVAAMALVAWLQEEQKATESVGDPEALKAELRRAAQLYLFSQYVARESLAD
jgi:hypothetical protein